MRGQRNLFQPGEVFGKLTIIKRWTEKTKGRKSKETFCSCKCSCGVVVNMPARYIASKHTQSCGCLRKAGNQNHHAWKGYGEISASWWGSLKQGCKRSSSRTIEFDITIEEAWNLFLKQNRKCAISGVPIGFPIKCKRYGVADSTASLDRIDSSQPYVLENVQWVHKVVNFMKLAMPQSELIAWCKTIAANNPSV